jgi:acyl-CoA reductase-like NAD-dependent aldehyde dehydrogenase
MSTARCVSPSASAPARSDVNGGMSMDVDLPFGGYKQSGVGKEWGAEGFDEYLEAKVVAVAEPA